MLDPLFSSALEQAERSAPAIRAAALVHLARVAAGRDRQQARDLLERGIAVANAIEEPTRQILLGEALDPAGAISPDVAVRLLGALANDPMQSHRVVMALYRMFEAGHHDAAMDYLLTGAPDLFYPYDVAARAPGIVKDGRTRAALLRRAIQAARAGRQLTPARLSHHTISELLTMFNQHWRALPQEEAGTFVREVVTTILAVPDERGSFTRQGAHFSSARQDLLFTLLGPCRHLEPQLADELVSQHSQLARAASRFPYGWESMYPGWVEGASHLVPPSMETDADLPRPPREREPDLEERASHDYLTLLDTFLPVAQELRTNFDRAFAFAGDAYDSDTDPRRPNSAPKACWPSAGAFRSILYKAGSYEGTRAERHLERIPDPDLRLLAQIELAAALAGVRQAPQTMITRLPDASFTGPPTADEPGSSATHAPFEPVTPIAIFEKPPLPPSYEARITPSRHPPDAPPAGGCDADFWVIENVRLRPVLTRLFDTSSSRIVIPASLEQRRYDFALVLPHDESREVFLDSMRSSVKRHFQVRSEQHAVEAQVVTAPRGVKARERPADDMPGCGVAFGSFSFHEPHTSPSMPDFSDLIVGSLMDIDVVPSLSRRSVEEELHTARERFLRMPAPPGILSALNQTLTMNELCIALESATGQLFVDETGTSTPYRINVNGAMPGSSREFVQLVCEELGLVVTPAQRVVEMLTVREPLIV
jgi:uncharacterized protein (TIGR03435 family)